MVHFPRWQIVLIIAVCVLGIVFAAPNLLDRRTADTLPDWLPNQQISLGLDLQGGSHLLLEVDTAAVLRELMESTVDEIRQQLRQARILYTDLGVDQGAAAVTIKEPADLERARALLREIGRDTQVRDAAGGRLYVELTPQMAEERARSAVQKSQEIIRRRIDETGVREPTIQRQGESRILVQLPGIDDPERMKELLGQTAKLSFHLVDSRMSAAEAARGRVPPGSELMPTAHPDDPSEQPLYLVRKRVVVSGENLSDASPSFDQRTNEPIVNFAFDTVGGRRFADATTEHVGERLAIVLDGKVISAPVIREPIRGGRGQISGSFTVAGANDLALLLRAGALPAPLTILEERTVGPGLGADSVAAGKIAGVIGLAAVIVFMAVAYGLFGLMANVALILNIVLMAALLSVLQATLTLPGIAGIVLTVGMAVDANVLIFERIREETRLGRTPISAIDAGYSRAMGTIIDSNLTTLIAAAALFMVGSGPVKGFAVTLSIGIVTSFFTAIMVSRLIVVMWLRRARPQELTV